MQNPLHIGALGLGLLCGVAAAQSSILNPPPPPPVAPAGWSEVDAARSTGFFFIAGQPDIAGLRAFADMGGAFVVNLRREAEMESVPFDEQAEANAVGLGYASIPVESASFSAEAVRAFDEAVRDVKGPILVHCRSGSRGAAMIAAHKALIDRVDLGIALREGFSLGMGSGMAEAVRRMIQQDPTMIADRIDADRLRDSVFTLAEFGTRHTMSETDSDERGIGAARRWLKQSFEDAQVGSGRTGDLTLRVEFDAHTVEPDGRRILEPVEVVNVLCTVPGSMPESRDRLIYVLGHYDSRASSAMDSSSDAPGANDDASGVAALIELARVFAKERLESTVVLMATAGEEQGLYGARAHARDLAAAGANVTAVFNNDTIGDPAGPNGLHAPDEVRLFSEGLPAVLFQDNENSVRALRTIRQYATESDSPSRQLARYIAEVARTFQTTVQPRLIYRPDRFLRGGDHTAFNEVGFSAVRFVEVYEDYTKQHQDVRVEDGVEFGDLPEFVDPEYLADVTRLNAAAIVSLANAPSPPANARMLVAQLSNDTTLRWDAVPEPDVAGYQVVWRATDSTEWSRVQDVGLELEATIDLSKDNWFFGVRSYDLDGYVSPVVTPVAARR